MWGFGVRCLGVFGLVVGLVFGLVWFGVYVWYSEAIFSTLGVGFLGSFALQCPLVIVLDSLFFCVGALIWAIFGGCFTWDSLGYIRI